MLTTREKVRRAVKWVGASQSAVARKAGVSRANLCDYLLGKADLKTETADAVMLAISELGKGPMKNANNPNKNKRRKPKPDGGGPVRADQVEIAEVRRPEDVVRPGDEVSGVGERVEDKSGEAGPGVEEEGL